MSRKRDKPYFSDYGRCPYPKRRRPLPPLPTHDPSDTRSPPPPVIIMGLSPDFSVLDLKSRFGHITYRSRGSAEAAIAASLDASFGIPVDSKRVQVLWATDPLAQWREAVGVGGKKEIVSSSKLLRAEIPLSRHGRGNKLASAIMNPRSSCSNASGGRVDVPFKGREIIAYDDIL